MCSTLFKVNNTPQYYFSGDRRYSVFQARLRNNCSNLNFDLFSNHLKLYETCECGAEREDAEHYLFQCHLYTSPRLKFFRTLHNFHPLNVRLLLYGSTNLNEDENERIFVAVQTFIKETKRF